MNKEHVGKEAVAAAGAVDARRHAAVQHTRGSLTHAEAAANMSGRLRPTQSKREEEAEGRWW